MNLPKYSKEYTTKLVNALCIYNVQKILPAVYTDELSYYELLANIQRKVNEVIESLDNLNDWQAAQDALITALTETVAEFVDGGYLDEFERLVTAWINEHFTDIMKAILNHGVYFGITEDGYFCANVVWQLTTYFDTIMDYASDDYGKLVLIY